MDRIDLNVLDDGSAFPVQVYGKIQKIKQLLSGKKIIVAFSGGVDSSTLLVLALKFAKEVRAVHFDSIFNSVGEKEHAQGIAKLLKIELHVMKKDPLACDDVRKNPPDRCYFCKKENFSDVVDLMKKLKFDQVAEGSNADDAGDYRPGMKAVAELGLISPLLAAGLSKEEIRQIARAVKLPNAEKPSSPCLATRFAYGVEITGDLIVAVGTAEAIIKARYPDITTVRARVHEGNTLRIEIDPASLERLLSKDASGLLDLGKQLKKLGFTKVSLDLEGYRTGSLNDLIKKEE
nr:ATP-dependent sacrificial sulfur transferase LarE [Candidatus Sigynarchaeota archaeon]